MVVEWAVSSAARRSISQPPGALDLHPGQLAGAGEVGEDPLQLVAGARHQRRPHALVELLVVDAALGEGAL
jgi:hypothetical protein